MSEALLSAFTSASSSSQIYFVTGADSVTIDGTLIFAIGAAGNSNRNNVIGGCGIVIPSYPLTYFQVQSTNATYRAYLEYYNSKVSGGISGLDNYSIKIAAAYTKD